MAQPAEPQFEGFFGNFAVRDLAVSGTYAFAPLTQFFTLGTPIIAINEPTQPNWRGMVDFTRVGAAVGVAVAADQQYVYTAAVDNAGSVVDNGTSATSFFMIGRYQPRFDHAGVSPSVSLVTPPDGQEVLVGNTLSISADASDDVEVDSVQFRVNGAVVGTDFTFPYEAAYTVPAGSGPLTVTATAADLGGNTGTSAPSAPSASPGRRRP